MPGALRVGLVGAGPWARRVHAPALAEHGAVDFVGVWARRSEAAADLARVHDVARFDDVADLIAATDAVAFAVPPAVQAELALDAVRAGRHVILEKPIAANLEHAERLAAAVAAAGVASIVVLVLRFAPETRAWLAEVGRLGGWRGGAVRWLSGALLGGDYASSPWRATSGALGDVGPHTIDLMDAALGPVDEVVASRLNEPDLWQLVLGHQSGATSTVTMSMTLPVEPTIVAVEVYGDHGVRPLASRQTPAPQCYATLLDEFIAMAGSGATTHPCDVHRGVHLQRVIDAARRLAARGLAGLP